MESYREKRNRSKSIIRIVHNESWQIFVSNTENDIHGRQNMAYKVMKHMNKNERDAVDINVIKEYQ